MKKLLFTTAFILSIFAAHSQDTDTTPRILTIPDVPKKKEWNKIDLSNRSNDHLLVQYGFDNWSATPDSVQPSGFSRHTNVYIMLDKPFKTNPKFSVGLGVGIGTSNIFFENTRVDIKSNSARLPFTKVDSVDHFKKFKLTTAYAEAPIELRYSSNPLEPNKSLKIAIGAKVGTLIDAHIKGKTLVNKSGTTVNSFILKEKSKKFFNSTRLAATARVGYGILSISGAYNITTLLKDAAGPVIRPYSVGITISGL